METNDIIATFFHIPCFLPILPLLSLLLTSLLEGGLLNFVHPVLIYRTFGTFHSSLEPLHLLFAFFSQITRGGCELLPRFLQVLFEGAELALVHLVQESILRSETVRRELSCH